MKNQLLAAALCCSVAAFAQPNFKGASKFAKTITAEDLKKQLTVIASADMEGRETATEGQRKAAAYIENYFKSLGLKPGNGNSYQQFYPVYRDTVTASKLVINNQELTVGKDYSVTAANYNASQFFGDVVYINFDDTTWKNSRIQVAGKLVMFKFKGLQGGAPAGRQFGNVLSLWVNQVMSRGALAALVVQDVFPLDKPAERLGNMTETMYPTRQSINYFNISAAAAKGILGADAEAFESGKLLCKTYPANVQLDYSEGRINLQSSNVIAVLEGTDKKDEYLFLTGHYDHLGKRDTVIYYGADDDGSGTVSVMEQADAFVKAKAVGKAPRRSVVFMCVSGEEKGLWGSDYFVNHPTVPLEKITADLNTDMVGRIDSLYDKTDTVNYVYVVGDDKLSSDLPVITAAANKFTNLKLDAKYNDPKDRMRIYFRSDHYNFAKKGVPIIFYFDGLHKDYHRPTDTVDKINFDVMAKRVQLVFYTAWEMANRDNMLVRDKPIPTATR